jgi:Uma2 family endonuclease
MVAAAEDIKDFRIGTTGWRASDLDDPRLEQLWFQGRYEIISGVLTELPPAYFNAGSRFMRLVLALSMHASSRGIAGDFANECDIIIDHNRVVRADMVWMSGDEKRRQDRAARLAGKTDLQRVRVLIPPSLVIESVSYGHEDHDRVTKFAWYAEFGVPHYWIFDALAKRLDCFGLRDGKYELVASGTGDTTIATPLFEGLTLNLAELWKD